MGLTDWFSSSRPESPAPQPSNDGGYIAPDRSTRAQCYEGRDRFFECLDRNDILDSQKEDEKARKQCPAELKEFERVCPASWVSDAMYTMPSLLDWLDASLEWQLMDESRSHTSSREEYTNGRKNRLSKNWKLKAWKAKADRLRLVNCSRRH